MCAKKVKNRKNNKNRKKNRPNYGQKSRVVVLPAQKKPEGTKETGSESVKVSSESETKTAEKPTSLKQISQKVLAAEALAEVRLEEKKSVEPAKEASEKPVEASENVELGETKVEEKEALEGKIEPAESKIGAVEEKKTEVEPEIAEELDEPKKTEKIVYNEAFMLAEAPKLSAQRREQRKVEKEIPKVAPRMGRKQRHTWLWWLVGLLAVALLTLGTLLAINLISKSHAPGDETTIVNGEQGNEQPGEEEKPAEDEQPEEPEEKPEESEKPAEEPPKEEEPKGDLPPVEPRPEPEPVPDLPDVTLGVTKLVALTFDDGPSSATTPRLLDILQSRNVKATFFVLGTMARKSPGIMQREWSEGHEVASHTMYHNQLTNLSAAQIRAEVLEMDQLFKEILGRVPPFTRPPYGSYNATVAEALGQPMILWSVDPRDWEVRNAAAVRARVVNSTQDGSIILLHDVHATTVDAVAGIIDDLHARGYEFVTVSELAELRNVPLVNGVAYGSFR